MGNHLPLLEPVEKPDSWIMKAAYAASKKMFGKVLTPMTVSYSRMPDALHFSRKLQEVEGKLSIGSEMSLLVKTLTAEINKCDFCVDIAKYFAKQKNIPVERFDRIKDYKTDVSFNEKERAALAYTEDVCLKAHPDEETCAELKKHFNEKEIVEIAWMIAAETYYNKMNHALNIGSDNLSQ